MRSLCEQFKILTPLGKMKAFTCLSAGTDTIYVIKSSFIKGSRIKLPCRLPPFLWPVSSCYIKDLIFISITKKGNNATQANVRTGATENE